MPDVFSVLATGIVSAAYFTLLGLKLARLAAPAGVPALGLAPALGWAVFCGVALPVLSVVGFSACAVRVVAALCLIPALWGLSGAARGTARLAYWVPWVAAAMAMLPTMALLGKQVPGGILLAPPMYDHVKIAIVDAILRNGLPVGNPFYGPGGSGHLAYYYLWHFGAAMIAAALHVSAWTAEAALTGFTAFGSMMLAVSLATAVGASRLGCAMVALLSLPGSLRTILSAWLGSDGGHRVILRESDIGGWLNQSAWVPQHLASACCVVLAVLMMVRLAEGGGLPVVVLLGLTVAAGFESSVWVGGIAFAAVGLLVGVGLLRHMRPDARWRFVLHAGVAAVLAALWIAPFAVLELHRAATQNGFPIAVGPYRTLGALVSGGWRRVLDAPAFWMLLLPFDLPAIVPLGAIGVWLSVRRPASVGQKKLLAAFAAATFGCLIVAWLLRSTIDNNDLGWRAVLPAVLLLAVFAGRGLTILMEERRWWAIGAVLAFAALGLPQMADLVKLYAVGQRPGDPPGFAASRGLWDAVRRYASPTDRVANNPLFLSSVTPWPVNISWALFSDRPSCYAGKATVIAYGGLKRPALADISARFTRVFGGTAGIGDVAVLAHDYDCRVAVVASTDGAWRNDPFLTAIDYRLAESTPAWRIYTRNTAR